MKFCKKLTMLLFALVVVTASLNAARPTPYKRLLKDETHHDPIIKAALDGNLDAFLTAMKSDLKKANVSEISVDEVKAYFSAHMLDGQTPFQIALANEQAEIVGAVCRMWPAVLSDGLDEDLVRRVGLLASQRNDCRRRFVHNSTDDSSDWQAMAMIGVSVVAFGIGAYWRYAR